MKPKPAICRSFWIEGCARGALRTSDLPRPSEGQVVVETLYSAISRGTEGLVFTGRVPQSVATDMRAPHQEGDFPWPVKYGYANVGRVIEGNSHLVGRSVFCLYPHQDWYVVDADRVVLLPEGLPPARAVLAANMETALNAVWDAELKACDRVTIVGGGVVGCLVAFLAARHPGTHVEVIDVDPSRGEVAREIGVEFALPEDGREEADVVFHASGRPEGLRTALRLAGAEANVVELSWYGTTEVCLPLGESFHPGRQRIIGSQVGSLPASQKARWSFHRRLAMALELCRSPELDVLISGESAFSDLPTKMKSLLEGGGLCHRIRYQ